MFTTKKIMIYDKMIVHQFHNLSHHAFKCVQQQLQCAVSCRNLAVRRGLTSLHADLRSERLILILVLQVMKAMDKHFKTYGSYFLRLPTLEMYNTKFNSCTINFAFCYKRKTINLLDLGLRESCTIIKATVN